MRALLFILAFLCALPPAHAQRVRRMSAPAFTPASIPGLVVWVNERGLSPGPIARWPNQGAAGSAADFIGAVNPPTVSTTLNGRYVASFDGVNDWMTNALSQINQPYNLFVIFRLNNASSEANKHIMDGLDASHRMNILADTSGSFYVSAGSGRAMFGTNAAWNAVGIEVNGASSSWATNAAIAQFSGTIGSNSTIGVILGCRFSKENFGQVDIAELLVFNRALNFAEKSAVMSYLRDPKRLGL